ncbi:ROK family transcriptional regulator [Consotaella aegiceratis]|uniref:ROK family transcriptional regulator n=1 Tax=Consotaella aegiceratis TaxID=3097961 RepID=UPI002F40E063
MNGRREARQGSVQAVLDLLRSEGPTSQANIARRTGLSRATINNIVRALYQDGVAEVHWINGREAVVSLSPKKGTILSIEVAPQFLHGAAFSVGSSERHDILLSEDDGSLEKNVGPEEVRRLVFALAERCHVEISDLAGIAIGMHAPIEAHTGAVAGWAASDLDLWINVPIAQLLPDHANVPIIADNDANLAALAEWTWGSGKGTSHFLHVVCSSKIGGGFIVDGKIYRGGNGMAGELGHLVIDYHSDKVCYCGSRGCLSTLITEKAILDSLRGSESPKDSLTEVLESARQGDPLCRRILLEAGQYLGVALADITKIIAPDVISVGGLLGSAGPLIFDGLRASIEVSNLKIISPGVEMRAGTISKDATILGGLAAVLEHLGGGFSELPRWAQHAQ